MLAVVGALALAIGEPLLFPSLGPTVLIQVQAPRSEAARAWNTVVGHAVGVAAAMLALAVTGAVHTPAPIGTGVLTWQRELASALAVGLTIAGQVPLRASHAPAAATTLLITLGAITPEWRAILIIAAGVALVTVLRPVADRIMERGERHQSPEGRGSEVGNVPVAPQDRAERRGKDLPQSREGGVDQHREPQGWARRRSLDVERLRRPEVKRERRTQPRFAG